MLTRFWQWTNGAAAPGNAATGIPVGPLRFRQWTEGTPPSGSGVTSLPFGALRFRQWTDGSSTAGDAVTSLPFGPLRFRAWTNGASVPPVDTGGGSGRPIRIPVDDRLRRLSLQRDDELLLIVAAAFVTLQ